EKAQALLSRSQVFQQRARLILTATRSQPRADHADQRRWMKRPLQEVYVAEQILQTLRRGIAYGRIATPGQQDQGKIGPWGLSSHPAFQASHVGGGNGFRGDNDRPGAALELASEMRDVGTYLRCKPRLAQKGSCNLG